MEVVGQLCSNFLAGRRLRQVIENGVENAVRRLMVENLLADDHIQVNKRL